jgi:hypothetical protein
MTSCILTQRPCHHKIVGSIIVKLNLEMDQGKARIMDLEVYPRPTKKKTKNNVILNIKKFQWVADQIFPGLTRFF